MNFVSTPSVPKGQFKCFACRGSVRSKDGAWHYRMGEQVFLCKPCEHAPAPNSQPASALGVFERV